MAWVSSAHLATTGCLLRFYVFPHKLPPSPPGRSHWDLETRAEPGAAPIGSETELWAPPSGGGPCPVAWRKCPRPRQVKRIRGGQCGHLEVGGLRSSLETAPGIAWVGGLPKFFRFYKCEAVSMSRILARKYFQESAFRELIGPHSERGFYSSQSAVFKSMGFSAVGQSRRINSLKEQHKLGIAHIRNHKFSAKS